MFQRVKNSLNNIPGWHTNRKIIVIESDDWGSIRMPSKKALQSLTSKGIKTDNNDNWELDCLESKEDLENLFFVLSKYKDTKDKHPVFTFNTVMGNPDFDKIRKSNFETFYFEHFFDSYKRYYGQDLKMIWEEGIEKGLIRPQFHAREHLNVSLWLKDLRNGNKNTKVAFDYDFFGLVTETSSINQQHYLAAYRTENFEELDFIKNATKEGLDIFKKTFGFRSKTFIACNYVWPKELESFVKSKGISLFQSQRGQLQPDPNANGKIKIRRHYTGQENSIGQIYTVRNVKFEPFENSNIDWIDQSLSEIQNAFFWHKPAIISTHRINYVGGINIKHRGRNLKLLDQLLQRILIKWPDVEFLSSDQLVSIIK